MAHLGNDDVFLFYLKYIRELVFVVYMYNCNSSRANNLHISRIDKIDKHTIIGPFADGSFEYNLRPGIYLWAMGEPPLVLVTSTAIYTCNDIFRLLHKHRASVLQSRRV